MRRDKWLVLSRNLTRWGIWRICSQGKQEAKVHLIYFYEVLKKYWQRNEYCWLILRYKAKESRKLWPSLENYYFLEEIYAQKFLMLKDEADIVYNLVELVNDLVIMDDGR